MKIHLLYRGAVLAALAVSSTLVFAQAGSLRAGAAKVELSIPASMFPITDKQKFADVHDPIYARALVLDNGHSKVALIVLEVTQLTFGAELVQAASDELKIPAANIILCGTHNHNSPSLNGGGFGQAPTKLPFFDIVKKSMIEAARQANANLQPARIGFGAGKAYVNTNRDQKIGDAYHMGYAPEGPSDKTVAVISVTKPTGEPIAIYANYPVHSVVMFLSKTKDGMTEVTSDLAGWTSNYVEAHFPGAVGLFTMGPAGDQNPLFMSTYNQDAPDVHDEGTAGWGILDVLSRRLGEEVVRVTRNIQNTQDKVVLWGGQATVTCPGRKFVPIGGQPAQPAQRGPNNAPMQAVDGDPVNINIGLLMINDIAIAGAAAELFNDVGQQIKRESIFDHIVIPTLLPDDVGYVPSDLAFTLPSQMAARNRLKPGCAAPALAGAFNKLEKEYLPIYQAATK